MAEEQTFDTKIHAALTYWRHKVAMPISIPHTAAQALFSERASDSLPVERATISLSESGALVYHWEAPCQEVAGLWVYVYDGYEIRISSHISHTHVERWQFDREIKSDREIWSRMVDEGIRQAYTILDGETVFIKSYDDSGNEKPSGGMWTRGQWIEQQSQARTNQRAWNWFGEVTVG